MLDQERLVDERDLTAMRDTMVHRGPDGSGNLLRGHVGLGHRRLSIVDLAGGHQPMGNEDGSIWVSFNGEIYNHQELRQFLKPKGHVFRTRSDTEAIVHLYEEEGAAGFSRMLGIFALAVYDARSDRLVLVRDRTGVKPLYYYRTPHGLVFGSEIKALLTHPSVRPEVNWPRVPGFLLYSTAYGEETLFKGIRRLPPGCSLTVDSKGVALRQYWDLPSSPVRLGDEAEQGARVEELLRQSVRRRLMSDVPLGAFLSGGLDSSLVVALMAEMVDEPVRTFSIGFAEDGYNEFRYSRLVAERFSTNHTEVTLDAQQFFDELPRLVWHYDEPIALAASVPLYFISHESKGKATVILTGEGADELFLGYGKYAWAQKHARIASVFQSLCPTWARQSLVRVAQRLLGEDRLLLRRLLMTPGDIAASFYRAISADLLDALLARDRPGRGCLGKDYDACKKMFEAAPPERDFLSRMTYMDFKTFLTTLLMKQDKMSMAASIESRVPFLDHELVEYGYTLATDRKFSGATHKRILKHIARKYLPAELVDREKQGFPVPVTRWYQRPSTRKRFEEILLDPRTIGRGIFQQAVIEDHLRAVAQGRRGDNAAATYLIWNLVNFELWQRTFIDGPAATAGREACSPASASHTPLTAQR